MNIADELHADTGYWQSTTPLTKAASSDKYYYYLPYWDNKQCMHVRSIWPDHRRRMYNCNMIAKIVDKFVSTSIISQATEVTGAIESFRNCAEL